MFWKEPGETDFPGTSILDFQLIVFAAAIQWDMIFFSNKHKEIHCELRKQKTI